MEKDFLDCPFCGKATKYKGFRYYPDGAPVGHVAGCSGSCGWEMHDKSYKRMQNKINRRSNGVANNVINPTAPK